jgi:hypothetical protein
MLKVARKTNTEIWHIIREQYWEHGNPQRLQTLMVRFFCEEKATDKTPHPRFKSNNFTIVPYNSTIHKKKACEDCVKAIKLYNKDGNRGQAGPSQPQTPSR